MRLYVSYAENSIIISGSTTKLAYIVKKAIVYDYNCKGLRNARCFTATKDKVKLKFDERT